MARHNREVRGQDQSGHEYIIEYQPDWLHQIKVSRDLDSGRQSTKTLFRNPDPPIQDPGDRIRTRISSPELGLDLQIALTDQHRSIRRITVEATIPSGTEQGETVTFSLTRRRNLQTGKGAAPKG